MKMKNEVLVNNSVYHVMSRSIAKYQIFNSDIDYTRMIQILRYYQILNPPTKYSMFLRLQSTQNQGFEQYFKAITKDSEKLVEIIAYCLMPNHIHLILKQVSNKGISVFMSNILNSYTRYFNILHKRKGPLWESRFKHVLVEKNEQLLHITRYLHLNPYSAKLVNKLELWKYSSYLEYINNLNDSISDYKDLLEINKGEYKKFVNDRKDYQRKLSEIKKLINI